MTQNPEHIPPTLGWYAIPGGASVLQTTGGVCDTAKYDYIICADPDRPCAELFMSLAERLNPGGRLLLAIENKYGLKYWCGACGGEIEGGGKMLSGAKLRRELEKTGFTTQKWYYPIPDRHHPRAVYSENKLPNSFFATVSPARLSDGTGVFLRESEILPGVIENGAFEFMSDSFIVEAALQKDAKMCSVDFAALTLYRPPDRAFITTVCSDGTAQKTAVYPEGVPSLQVLAENHARLRKRGIDALPVTIEGNFAKMPSIPHETLWDYMQKRVREGEFDRNEFIKIFDRLRADILRSSEQSPPGACDWDAALGSVLDYAYTEMIPANCFYDTAHDAFIYFDQEHALQKTPYSVPLSRALMSITYSAELRAHAEIMALLEELKARYGLTAIWDKLVEIEREFIADLSNSTEAAQTYNRAVSAADAEINTNRRAHKMLAAAAVLLRKYKNVGVYGNGKRGRRFIAALEMLDNPAALIADEKTGGLPRDAAAEVIVVTPKENAEQIAAALREQTQVPVILMDEIS